MKNIRYKWVKVFAWLGFVMWTPAEGRADLVVFLYALDADWAALQAEGAQVRKTERVGDLKIQLARLGGHEVVAARLGAGQVESAAVVATVLARYRADWVLSTGAVGGIDDGLAPGVWVNVDRVVGWQAGTEGTTGWSPAERGVLAVAKVPVIDHFEDMSAVTTASAEIFVAAGAERERLRVLTGARVVDMNLYGAQKAIAAHQLPALHLRVVSDRADENASRAFAAFVAAYDGALGRRAATLLRKLSLSPLSPDSRPELRALRGE